MQAFMIHIQDWIASFGWLAPFLFIVIFAVAMMLFMISTPFFVSAGALFGAGWGILYCMVGALIAAVGAFFVSRRYGAARLERYLKKHETRLLTLESRLLGRFGWLTILILRVLPLIPFPVMNYGLGLTRVPFKHYLLGTVIGILPAVTVYVAFGHAVFSFGLLGMVGTFAVVVLFLFGISYLAQRYDARHNP